MSSSTSRPAILSAVYASPDNESFQESHTISLPASSSVDDKTAYLGQLRTAARALQDSVNRELTARMEEDKTRQPSGAGPQADDAKEEDNYGEEVVEEDN